jgi:hypothetical protein
MDDNAFEERFNLVNNARRLAGPTYEHKGKDTRQIKEEALAAAAPKHWKGGNLEDKSDDYVDGLFDSVVAKHEAAGERADSARDSHTDLRRAFLSDATVMRQDATETRLDADAEWEKMRDRNRNAWRQPAPSEERNDAARTASPTAPLSADEAWQQMSDRGRNAWRK